MHDTPVSVISVNLNNASGLETTIQSVLRQKLKNLQYIVVDGGSGDGSVSVMERHRARINHAISEPDRGIYHAMNKGLEKAQGDYVIFLNSGDFFLGPHVLEQLLVGGCGADLIYGNLEVSDNAQVSERRYPERLSFRYFLTQSLPHPATLIRRRLFNEVGLFEERQKIVSDWSFFTLAFARHNCSYRHVPVQVSHFTLDGLSSRQDNADRIEKERRAFLATHFPAFLEDYVELETLHQRLVIVQRQTGYRIYGKLQKLMKSDGEKK